MRASSDVAGRQPGKGSEKRVRQNREGTALLVELGGRYARRASRVKPRHRTRGVFPSRRGRAVDCALAHRADGSHRVHGWAAARALPRPRPRRDGARPAGLVPHRRSRRALDRGRPGRPGRAGAPGRGGGGRRARGRGVPHGRPPGFVLPRRQRGRHRAPARQGGAGGRAPLRPHVQRGRARARAQPSRRRVGAARAGRHLPGHQGRSGSARPACARRAGPARGRAASRRDLRPRRDAPAQALPGRPARPLRDRRLGTAALSPRLHRRPARRVRAGPDPSRGAGARVHRGRAAVGVPVGAGGDHRAPHGRTRAAVPRPRLAGPARGRFRRGHLRPAGDRAAPASTARGLLDQEPLVLDRAGAPPARLRAQGGRGGGRGADGRLVPPGGMAVTDRAAKVVLAVATDSLLAGVATVRLPGFWGDGATYYSMAWSLAEDGDLRYEARDVLRTRREMSSGPQGVFLKRASGGLRWDGAGGFPWVRRVRADEPRIYFAKAFTYPLAAAPLVALFGTRGLLILNALALGLVLALVYSELRRNRS